MADDRAKCGRMTRPRTRDFRDDVLCVRFGSVSSARVTKARTTQENDRAPPRVALADGIALTMCIIMCIIGFKVCVLFWYIWKQISVSTL